MIRLNTNIGVKGRYKIEKVFNAGSCLEYKVPLTGWFDNLVLNNGLDKFMTASFREGNNTIFLGSGNSTPVVGQLALDSVRGNFNTQSCITGNYGAPNYIKWAPIIARVNAGPCTGNISEVGCGASGSLISRALILDSGGNPTTITKLSDEVLDVTFELQIQQDTGDTSGEFTLTGSKGGSYTYTMRAAEIGVRLDSKFYVFLTEYNEAKVIGYSGSINSITGMPSGTSYYPDSYTWSSYTSGSFQRDLTSYWGLASGNSSTGLASLLCQVCYRTVKFQAQLNTPIMKTSSDVLTIVSRYTVNRV